MEEKEMEDDEMLTTENDPVVEEKKMDDDEVLAPEYDPVVKEKEMDEDISNPNDEIIELKKRIDESGIIPLKKSSPEGYPDWSVMRGVLRKIAGHSVSSEGQRSLQMTFPGIFGEEG